MAETGQPDRPAMPPERTFYRLVERLASGWHAVGLTHTHCWSRPRGGTAARRDRAALADLTTWPLARPAGSSTPTPPDWPSPPSHTRCGALPPLLPTAATPEPGLSPRAVSWSPSPPGRPAMAGPPEHSICPRSGTANPSGSTPSNPSGGHTPHGPDEPYPVSTRNGHRHSTPAPAQGLRTSRRP